MTSPSIVLLRTQTDERLVALARDGHERAFEAIVERYRRPLLRTCRRVLSEARAEDALQQALMAAWRGLRRGDEVRELRPWLHRIAHNTALNHLRMAGYDFDELKDALRIADGPDDELERRAVVRQTLTGLAALPQRQRDALLAIAVEGRSQDEVAEQLGLSQGAVRQLVHRARTTLRAAATAVTPLPLVSWAAGASTRAEPMAQRIADLAGGAGGAGAAAALAKAGAVVVLAGGAVGGPALVEQERSDGAAAAQAAERRSGEGERARPAGRTPPLAQLAAPSGETNLPDPGRAEGPRRGRGHGGPAHPPRSGEHRFSSSGPGRRGTGDRPRSRGDDDFPSRRSGPSGDDDRSGRSGPSGDDRGGSGGDDGRRSASSGPGDGTSGREESGSGTSGSGTSGSGTSGSGTSGSGTSGSGTSGSGGSGSGTSGSGTSGSGDSGGSGSADGGTAGSSFAGGSSGTGGGGGSGSSGGGRGDD